MSSTPVRHILELSRSEKIDFLQSFDTVFSDCEGVLWEPMQQPIEGVGDSIKKLKKHDKEIIFITNNSIRSNEDTIKQFNLVEVEIDMDKVIHPVRTIINYLRDIKFDGLIFCVATTNFQNALKDAGFQVIAGPNKILSESFTELAKHVFDKEPVRAVIVDVDLNLSSPKLIRAGVYLRNPECIFIGGAADITIPFGPTNTIGPGTYLRALEQASRRKAVTLGKPGQALVYALKKRFNYVDPKRALMIGDNLDSDIAFGKMCGFQSLIVLTGATKKEDLNKARNTKDELPDYYADSMADFNEFFRSIEYI